jgi:hypothetical protein
MTDILDEVHEEFQQEKTRVLIKKLIPIIGAVIFIIILTASIYVWQKNNKTSQQEQVSVEFFSSMQEKYKDLENLRSIIDSGTTGYSLLASFQLSNKYIEEKKPQEALVVYETISANKDAPREMRNIATILATQISVKNNLEFQVEEKLGDIIAANGSYKDLAMLLLASHNFSRKDYEASINLTKELVESKKVSSAIKNSAESLLILSKKKNA